MIALDEDALVCDFAETYHIYDMRSFPGDYIATLALGLRESSRIKMKLNGVNIDAKTLLLAHIADNTAINVYLKTEDAKRRRNRPQSLLKILTQTDQKQEAKTFRSGDDFMNEWRRLNGN